MNQASQREIAEDWVNEALGAEKKDRMLAELRSEETQLKAVKVRLTQRRLTNWKPRDHG